MTTDIMQLPVPDKLDQKATKRSLMTNVRSYFFKLWNHVDAKIKEPFHTLLASVGATSSINKSLAYDRAKAVDMILAEANTAKDTIVLNAKAGDILKCLSKLMSENGMGLKLRRREYARLTHAAPAE